jgi:hypothetical protein
MRNSRDTGEATDELELEHDLAEDAGMMGMSAMPPEPALAQEIPIHEWTTFFEDFTDRYRGKIVTLESREPDSTETEAMAEGLPLVGVSVDFQDNEEGTIQVMVGVESNDHFTHTVIEPTFIWRYQSASGADEAIEIESAAGPTTLVRL